MSSVAVLRVAGSTPVLFSPYQFSLLQPRLSIHGVQRRMISLDIFCTFEIIIFCFVVTICDLVHAVRAMYGLP